VVMAVNDVGTKGDVFQPAHYGHSGGSDLAGHGSGPRREDAWLEPCPSESQGQVSCHDLGAGAAGKRDVGQEDPHGEWGSAPPEVGNRSKFSATSISASSGHDARAFRSADALS
jgi:hypothetical protein